MAVRQVIQTGDKRLTVVNKKIEDFNDSKVKQVIEDLVDTLKVNGIGLAAPQIGENYQIFVTEPRETKFRTADQSDKLRIYINPRIVKFSKEESLIYEGCVSVPDVFGPVLRAKEITIEAFDQNGKKFRLMCDGILARVIQHEYDHLNGIEFLEKVIDDKKLISGKDYIENIRSSAKQNEASVITKKELFVINNYGE